MISAIILASLLAASAPSEQSVADRIDNIATLGGQCQSLVVANDNHNDVCGAQLINIAYVSGESSFMIAVGDGNMVSFFGRDSTAVGNAATIAISRITATFGDDTTSLSARGQCRYTNPYAGVSTVTCNATTARGLRYSLVFRSDGNPPTVQRMQR